MVIYATLISDLKENTIYLPIKITPRVGNSKKQRRQTRISRTNKTVCTCPYPTSHILEDMIPTEDFTGESVECEIPM